MSRPETYEEGLRLISELLDGSISDADFGRLHALLEADPELRRLYMQSVDQEIELSYRPGEASKGVIFPFRWFPGPALAAAAILIAALCLILLVKWRSSPVNPGAAPSPPPIAESGEAEPESSSETAGPDPSSRRRVILPEPTRSIPRAPETWAVDFESGLPTGWDAEFASADLPAGSRGAVRTVTKTNDENGTPVTYRNITPPMAWDTGHFTIRDDTHLHLVLKLENADHFDIFLMTHSSDPARPDGMMMYKFTDNRLWAEEGKWRAVSIPLARFMGKDQGEFVNDLPPQSGEVAWQLFFSAANNDLRMVIDEIRIDRGGPGEFVIDPVE